MIDGHSVGHFELYSNFASLLKIGHCFVANTIIVGLLSVYKFTSCPVLLILPG